MYIKKDHIPRGTAHNRRPGLKMNPSFITIHSTANPNANAEGERGWLTNNYNKRTASWHYVVDSSGTIIEAIPVSENAWHAGDGYNGTGNRDSIGIEISESGDLKEAMKHAVELTVYLMKKHGIKEVRRHYDWSGKICPGIMYDGGSWNTWEWFMDEVKAAYHEDEEKTSPYTHKIVSGDTLWELSRKYDVSIEELKDLNPSVNVMALQIGDRLVIKEKPQPKKLGTVRVKAAKLWYYGSADWNDKVDLADRNDVFTVVDKLEVNGYDMYKLISNTFITANSKYVDFDQA